MLAPSPDAPTCLLVQPIHPAGIDRLHRAGIRVLQPEPAAPQGLADLLGMADAAITRNAGLSAEAIEAAPRLRVIAVHGVGTDAVAIDAASERGILVVNTPGANTRSVAEHAIALLFALAKSLPRGDRAVRAGDPAFKYAASFTELGGKTFGILGLGAIGRATAELARAIGMKTIGYAPRRAAGSRPADGIERCERLEELLARSDVVSLHLALAPGTRHILGAPELALMKPTAFLINTARGGLVDEAALVEALAAHRIAGAGLDVFAREPLSPDSPIAALENVVLSPHVAGSSEEALRRMALAAADQVIDVLAGRPPAHPVNRERLP